ncbi:MULTISPECIES: hypothetical protein [Amycolatopsis]|uniref:Uncharacterized protein n=1 Tax=Amycolatopsis bullii TaxID=941987 RepID=A0ABQ3K1J0_9PSEU|nr:hypothetical protein [Amycolatopsis bullii]GHF90193.1 hypothetical protein GCM10017567_00110 [Amycolatopsis bullii]
MVRYANESSPVAGITYWSIPELTRITRAPAPADRFGAGSGQDRVSVVEPVVAQQFLGAELSRYAVDEQMCCSAAAAVKSVWLIRGVLAEIPTR